jgi:hypothetical protein
LLLGAIACAHVTQEAVGPSRGVCKASPPAGAQLYNVRTAASLAGTYDLQLVVTAGSRDDDTGPYRLVLWANDSARRYAYMRPAPIGRWPGERPLAGYLDGALLDENSVLRSREPDRPGATVIDSVLHVGPVDVLDGGGDWLVIGATTPEGFWGRWHRDRGIELDPHPTRGRFCAIRVE